MEMKIVGVTLAAFVSLVVLAAVLMPILDDATTTEETFTNTGLWRMKEIETGDTWARVSDGGTGYKWTLNGVDQISGSDGSNAVLGDDWCVRANGQTRGHTVGGNVTNITATAGESNVVLSGGGMNGNGNQSKSGYGVDTSGQYLMLAYNTSAYVKGDSIIYGTGQSNVDGAGLIVNVVATIDDGVTITVDTNFSNSGTPTISNLVVTDAKVNYTPVDGYVDLYKFTSITATLSFDITPYGGGDATSHSGDITYSSVVVPYEVTAELSQHLTDGQNQLLAVIPVLVIVAILLAVIALVIRSRLD